MVDDVNCFWYVIERVDVDAAPTRWLEPEGQRDHPWCDLRLVFVASRRYFDQRRASGEWLVLR